MSDLFLPRKVLTAHLQQLVAQGELRYVGQAHEFADCLEGKIALQHAAVYVIYDKYRNISHQAKNVKLTQQYSVVLAWQNNQPARSGKGHGMDEAGELLSRLISHVQGLVVKDGDASSNPAFGKKFTLTQGDDTVYPPHGWALYSLAFEIDIINLGQ